MVPRGLDYQKATHADCLIDLVTFLVQKTAKHMGLSGLATALILAWPLKNIDESCYGSSKIYIIKYFRHWGTVKRFASLSDNHVCVSKAVLPGSVLWVSIVPSEYFLGSECVFLGARLTTGVDLVVYTLQRIFSARHKEKTKICLENSNSKKKYKFWNALPWASAMDVFMESNTNYTACNFFYITSCHCNSK